MQYGINFNFRKCELYQLISARDQGSKILKTQFFMFTAIKLKLWQSLFMKSNPFETSPSKEPGNCKTNVA